MLDDIDYSALQPSGKQAASSQEEAPKKKASVASRSVVKKEALERKPVDSAVVGKRAEALSEELGAPTIEDPISQYALPAAGILGGLAAAYGLYRSKANTSFPTTEAPELSVPADQKGASAVGSVVENVAQSEAIQPKPLSPMEVLQQRKEQLKAAGIGVQPPAAPAGPTYNVPTANVPAAPAPVKPPLQLSEWAMGGPAPAQPPMAPAIPEPAAPAIADAVATGQSPAKAIQMDVAKQIEATPTTAAETPAETGIKKRAAKTPVTFKSAEKLPEGMSFRADLGPGDNWLYNTYGPEGRKAILAQFNEGKPAVSYERAKELSQLLQQERIGPAIPRDVAKERGIAPPETNYGKLGKAVKVAGVAGLGLTAAQLAQAAQQAQQGDYSAAREFGFNLLGMIPGLASAFNLGTYSPELGAGEQKELAKRRRMAPTID